MRRQQDLRLYLADLAAQLDIWKAGIRHRIALAAAEDPAFDRAKFDTLADTLEARTALLQDDARKALR